MSTSPRSAFSSPIFQLLGQTLLMRPVHQRLVFLVQQCDFYRIDRRDDLIIKSLFEPGRKPRFGWREQTALQRQRAVLPANGDNMFKPVFPTFLHGLGVQCGIEATHGLEAHVKCLCTQAEFHAEKEVDGLIKTVRVSFAKRHGQSTFMMSKPSWTSSMVSMATSLASAFRSVDCTLVGQALRRRQVTMASCSSLSSFMVTVRRY